MSLEKIPNNALLDNRFSKPRKNIYYIADKKFLVIYMKA